MVEMIVGTYGVLCWLVFKKFKLIPVTTYTITTSSADYETWWPTHYRSDGLPQAPAGHDHSSFEMTERILVSIMHGKPLDYGQRSIHYIGTLLGALAVS